LISAPLRVTRADVIKYVANVAHGVHTSDAKEPAHLLIREVRNRIQISSNGGMFQLGFVAEVRSAADTPIKADPKNLDAALLVLFGTGQHLVASPDVIKLEAEIAAKG
jgi:hypothetical protein